jgi:hypothetical protein
MEEITKIVDIEKAIKNGDSRFLKSLPAFVFRLIKRLIL